MTLTELRKTKIGSTLAYIVHKVNKGLVSGICNDWSQRGTGIVNFYNWSVENGYKDGYTLELKDRDGIFEPSNCMWVDKSIKNTNNRLYRCWADIKSRCNDKNNKSYVNYGAIGITYSKEWDSFTSFYNWAINNGYSDNLTIDRIDVNGNYEPLNCRWSDKSMQNFNKHNNSKIYPGVSYIARSNRYQARISNKYIGQYTTAEEAIKARKQKELEYFGEYLEK